MSIAKPQGRARKGEVAIIGEYLTWLSGFTGPDRRLAHRSAMARITAAIRAESAAAKLARVKERAAASKTKTKAGKLAKKAGPARRRRAVRATADETSVMAKRRRQANGTTRRRRMPVEAPSGNEAEAA